MICEKCDYALDAFDKTCPRCQAKEDERKVLLAASGTQQSGTSTTPPEPRPYFDYNPRTEGLCARCRKPNLYTERACKRCGHRLPWAKTVTVALPPDTPPNDAPIVVTPPITTLPINTPVVDNSSLYTTILDDDDLIPYSPPSSAASRDSITHNPHAYPQSVSNEVVWLIAFSPLITALIQVFIAGASHAPINSLWWIGFLLNSLLCMIDLNILKNACKNTEGLTSWAFFLVPIYLFLRAERLDESPTYAWAWIAMFCMMLMPVLLIPVAVAPATP